MKVMITGGAGFIGANLVHHILRVRPDWQVMNVDALTYAGNLENLKGTEGNPRYSFLKADITDAGRMAEVFEDCQPDGVFHLAAESHVDRSILDPTAFVRTNVLGTQNLLNEALIRGSGFRFLHVSTDEVYGTLGLEGKFTEETPYAPNSPYAASKAASDMLVRAAFKTHGLNAVTTNCSNNYGPYQFPEKLIPLMISNALENEPLPVYGDGMQVRDWLYVEDHCAALLRAFEKGEPGRVYNVGGDSEKPNIEIVRAILEHLGRSEELIRFVEDRPGHDRRYAIDASRIKEELGWEPAHRFEEALPKTIDWYVQNRDWVERVRSGAYREYYETQYGNRIQG